MTLFHRYLPIAQAREWHCVLLHAVGGLTEVGFSQDESFLLVVSHAGRGLFNLSTGKRVERDDEPPALDSTWIKREQRLVQGIGLAKDKWFPVAGLWGGDLPKLTQTNWAVEVVAKGRDELAILRKSNSHERWLVEKSITEIKAFGFSNSGRYLVLGTSSDVAVFVNEA
jgi:hypothetical protein